MRVLVTGGSGFIGKHVVRLLEQHAEVLACDRKLCDMSNPHAIESVLSSFKPTHCVHLAWDARGAYAQAPSNIHCLTAGVHLIQKFFEHGGQRFVGVGTCFEYAPVTSTRSELATLTLPDTLYGKCKLALGSFLEAFASCQELSWAWCRPFYITGPGESAHRLIPSACSTFLRGEDFYTAAYHNVLDYMDVRDVADVLCTLLITNFSGVVNVASGTGFAVGEMLNMLEDISGTSCKGLPGAETTIRVNINADVTVLRDIMKYTPQFSMRQTLEACWEDIRSRA